MSAKTFIRRGLVIAAIASSVAVAGAQAGTVQPPSAGTLLGLHLRQKLAPPDLVLTHDSTTRVRVANTGLSAAGPFQIAVTSIVNGEPAGRTFSVPGLGGGESFSFSTTSFGCRLLIKADATNAVAESNEQNNVIAVNCQA